MNIIDALTWRYATKKFDREKKIGTAEFNKLIDSLVLTPSSFGLQPWKFITVKNPEIREELKPFTWNQDQTTDASHLIIFCGRNTIDEKYLKKHILNISEIRGVPEKNLEAYSERMANHLLQDFDELQRKTWVKNQIYIALGNLLTCAAIMGIDTCPIEGFLPDKYDDILKLSERGLFSVVVCALGYRHFDDPYSKVKKVRFSSTDLIETVE